MENLRINKEIKSCEYQIKSYEKDRDNSLLELERAISDFKAGSKMNAGWIKSATEDIEKNILKIKEFKDRIALLNYLNKEEE